MAVRSLLRWALKLAMVRHLQPSSRKVGLCDIWVEKTCGKTSLAPVYPELIKLPPSLADAIRTAETGKGWRSIGFGVRQLPLGDAEGVNAEILRIPPGVATPKHTHRGREYTLCLVGTFSDATGEYGPGDVAYADPSVTHQPTADRNGGPVFVLAITDGGLQLTGLMGVLQRLTGH